MPKATGLDAEFFRRAVTTGRLHLQRCTACANIQHPPRFLRGACAGRDLSWVEAEGTGSVYSWSMSHFTIDRAWQDRLPYATVVVETTEGVRLVGSYAGHDADLALGEQGAIRPEPINETFAHIWFDPREGPS